MTPYSRNATLPADWKWAPHSTLPLHTPAAPPLRRYTHSTLPLRHCSAAALRHCGTAALPHHPATYAVPFTLYK
jgi:hypothetical protein